MSVLDRLEALREAATPGRWYRRHFRWISNDRPEAQGFPIRTFDIASMWDGNDYADEDAELIVAMHAAVPGLVRVARAAAPLMQVLADDEAANPPGHRSSIVRVHRNDFHELRSALASLEDADTKGGTDE